MALIKLTSENFDQEVLESDIPVLVDFWAEWCSPCKMLVPVLENLSSEYAGKIKICKIDVDEFPDFAGKYSVQSIPTIIVFNRGEQIKQNIGALPKDTLVAMFSDLV